MATAFNLDSSDEESDCPFFGLESEASESSDGESEIDLGGDDLNVSDSEIPDVSNLNLPPYLKRIYEFLPYISSSFWS